MMMTTYDLNEELQDCLRKAYAGVGHPCGD